MSDNTTLRQANNKVELVGYLKKNELEYSEDRNVILGSITIATDKNSDYIVNVYVNRITQDGSEASAFKGLETFIEGSKSIAQLLTDKCSEEEAWAKCTCVSVNKGQLTKREYYDSENNLISHPSISSRFFNRVDGENISAHASFDVECVIQSIKHEFKNQEPTGRLIVEVWIPSYKGNIFSYTFIVNEDLADDFESTYAVNNTCNIWGNLINSVEVSMVRKQGIGAAKNDETRTYINEAVITGGIPPYEEESLNYYSTEVIKKAIQKRENEYLPQLLSKFKERNSKQDANSNTSRSGFVRTSAAPVSSSADDFKI